MSHNRPGFCDLCNFSQLFFEIPGSFLFTTPLSFFLGTDQVVEVVKTGSLALNRMTHYLVSWLPCLLFFHLIK